MNQNTYAVLRSRFPADPSRACLRLPDGADISYGELERQSGHYAALLRGLGVQPGDRVAAQIEKSPQALYLYLASLRVGAIFLPLNTAYTAAEIAFFAGDAQPCVMVCDVTRLTGLQPVASAAGVRHLLSLNADGSGTLAQAAADCTIDPVIATTAADDTAAILYTSGTTGRAKGAMLSHANLCSNALALHALWGFRADDVLLHALPTFHVHGLFVATHCALLNGSPMWFLPRFDPAEVLRFIPQSTVMMGVPTFYTRLLQSPELTREVCANMRLFISGSAPLLAETHHAFAEKTGHAILERYGMTEAGMITSNPLDGRRVPGTVGFPLPKVAVRVTGTDESRVGRLEIRGPNVFSGYWRMPEKTAQEFTEDGWFITGDLASIADDGRVTIVGRGKDLIISGGLNIYPKEVELAIDALDGVLESAVIGLPHKDFGEAVFAVVVGQPAVTLEEGTLIAALQSVLAKFKRPKSIAFLDELPRNSMGKVQKAALRDRFHHTFD